MINRIFYIICTVALLGACSHQAAKPSNVEAATDRDLANCDPIQHDYRDAVVKLMDFQGSTASGVVVAPNRVLTVAHALTSHGLYADIQGVPTQTRILAHNAELDLAYLEVYTRDIRPLEIASTIPIAGEAVWAAGFPLAKHQRISTGYFQSTNNGRLYTSVHINQGASGGALMRCEDGFAKLTGIIHGYIGIHRDGAVINIGDSSSVSVSTIKAFLQTQSEAQIGFVYPAFSG